MASLNRYFKQLNVQHDQGTNEVVFQYVSRGGRAVNVPRTLKPYVILGIPENATQNQTKEAFRKAATHPSRQQRVLASLSYQMLLSGYDSRVRRYRKKGNGCYEIIGEPDVFVIAAAGDTKRLLDKLEHDRSLLEITDEYDHTLLYLTARSGFYDTTEALLKLNVSVNDRQIDNSTPLHGASYYGQELIVGLLLRYGADVKIKNKWNNRASDEAATSEIKQIISSHKEDNVSLFVSSLMDKKTIR